MKCWTSFLCQPSVTSCFTSIHFRSHQSSRVLGFRVAALVPVRVCVCVLSCAVKFLCQRKSSMTRLQQTCYDSVQGRPNRAPIQLPATGSLLLTQSLLTVRPLRARKEGSSPPWKNSSHVPVWATSDVSFCYHGFKFTDKKGNVLTACGRVHKKISNLGYKVSWCL